LTLDGQGNVYVAGSTYVIGSLQDYLIIKYNSNGDTAWVRRYDNASSDVAVAIVVDNQNNIYVSGNSYGTNTDIDYATVKYNSSGVQQWVSRYNGPLNNEDSPTNIAIDNQSNIYVTGYSYGLSYNKSYTTIKYNSDGDTLWVKRYTTPENADDEPEGIAVDNQCNVYITGSTDSTGTGNASDILTIKYNSAGMLQWFARYSSPGNQSDMGNAIAVDNQRNVYVTGYYYGSTSYNDAITIKYAQSPGIEEVRGKMQEVRGIEVYPNPARSYFVVRIPSSVKSQALKIFDVTGKVVKEVRIKKQETRISLDGIKNGVYFVKVTTPLSLRAEGVAIPKTIINKLVITK